MTNIQNNIGACLAFLSAKFHSYLLVFLFVVSLSLFFFFLFFFSYFILRSSFVSFCFVLSFSRTGIKRYFGLFPFSKTCGFIFRRLPPYASRTTRASRKSESFFLLFRSFFLLFDDFFLCVCLFGAFVIECLAGTTPLFVYRFFFVCFFFLKFANRSLFFLFFFFCWCCCCFFLFF